MEIELAEGVTYEKTCHASPVQVEGHVDGYPFYFRARWGQVWFGIPNTADGDSVEVAMGITSGFNRTAQFSDDEYAGWLPDEEVGKYLGQWIYEWRKEKKNAAAALDVP